LSPLLRPSSPKYRAVPPPGNTPYVPASMPGPGSESLGLRLLAVLALVLANAFFVAAEFALVAARRTRIEALVRRGDRKARTVQAAFKDLYRARLPIAAPDERLDARAAGRDQCELGGHEERVGQHEGQHRQQAEAERFRAGAGHRGGNIGRVARWRNGPVFWGRGTKQGGQVS